MTRVIKVIKNGAQVGAYRDPDNAVFQVANWLTSGQGEMTIKITEEVEQDLAWLSVAIDTGHGGADPGAVDGINPAEGDTLDTVEKVVNYQTGLALIAELQARGARVVDLRAHGGTMDLLERSQAANQAVVQLLISLHANAAANAEARGFEVFYYSGLSSYSKDGRVADAINSEVSKIINSRGVKVENLHMLRETKMPAVLLEAGFLTNPEDERLLNDPTWIAKYAKAIADGVAACKPILKGV